MSFTWTSPDAPGDFWELRDSDWVAARARLEWLAAEAEVGGRRYRIERLRWPPYLTLHAADELVARMCLIPSRGYLAEFADESFRLGWLKWMREWAWTDEREDAVVVTSNPWWGGAIEVQVSVNRIQDPKWPLLATLQLAMATTGPVALLSQMSFSARRRIPGRHETTPGAEGTCSP